MKKSLLLWTWITVLLMMTSKQIFEKPEQKRSGFSFLRL